jgi:hypothetical protein
MVKVGLSAVPVIQNKKNSHDVYDIRNVARNDWKARVRHPDQYEALEYSRKIEEIFRQENAMPRKVPENDVLQAN